MSRADQWEDIFLDAVDRHDFIKTLAAAEHFEAIDQREEWIEHDEVREGMGGVVFERGLALAIIEHSSPNTCG